MASPIVAGVRAGMSPRNSAGSPSSASPQQVTTASEQVREYFAHAAEVASNAIAQRGGDPGRDLGEMHDLVFGEPMEGVDHA